MKSRIAYSLFFLFILVTAQAQLLADEVMVLETPTGNLEGTMLCPYSNGKVPVVLIIAGSGPTDRNGNSPSYQNNSLKLLAEGLEANAIASLRFDKRGVAKSGTAGLEESTLRFDHYIADVVAWVALLKKDQRFSEIIIAGHSEGSLIGLKAAQETTISKYISLAGAGYPASEVIRLQLKDQPQTVLDQALPILKHLEEGETVTNIPPMFNTLFRESVQPYMISWFKYKPQEEIAKLTCPALIIQGTTDIQVSVDNAEVLKKAYPKAQLSIITGMNHILKEAPEDKTQNIASYSQPYLKLHPELIDTLVKFISAK